jgi:hypothetical protein
MFTKFLGLTTRVFFFIFVYIITKTTAEHALSSCLSLAANEAGAQTCFTSSDVSVGLEKDEGSKLLESLLLRGFFDASELLLTSARANGLDLSTTLHQASSSIRTKLQTLADNLQNAASAVLRKSEGKNGIAPAAEWAQSPDSIFLNVKFSHKLDAPATLGCELDGAPTFTSTGVKLFADCKEKRKAFLLDLSLFREILPENCSFSITSVGRASITLKKLFNSSWPRLLSSKAKPGNIHVWWAMKEKYSDELSTWEKADAALKATKSKNQTIEANNETSIEANGESDTTSSSTESSQSPSPSPSQEVFSPSEAALQKAFKLLELQKAKDQRQLERVETEELSQALDKNVRYKRGVDEAAKGQKEEADKRYEEQKKAAQEKKQKSLTDLTERYTIRRKLAEDRFMAAGALGKVDNIDAEALVVEETEVTPLPSPEAEVTTSSEVTPTPIV